MPVNEMKRPSAIARCARSAPPVKQCSTAGKIPNASLSERSWSAATWMSVVSLDFGSFAI